jgi:hypothetical protein
MTEIKHVSNVKKLNHSLPLCQNIVNGIYILPHFVNAKYNLNFFKDVLFHLLEDVPLDTRAFLRFFHDDDPCHNAHIVRNWRNNNNFPSRLHRFFVSPIIPLQNYNQE